MKTLPLGSGAGPKDTSQTRLLPPYDSGNEETKIREKSHRTFSFVWRRRHGEEGPPSPIRIFTVICGIRVSGPYSYYPKGLLEDPQRVEVRSEGRKDVILPSRSSGRNRSTFRSPPGHDPPVYPSTRLPMEPAGSLKFDQGLDSLTRRHESRPDGKTRKSEGW